MLKKNKNYKLVIGLIIGFLVSSTVVSALYLGTAFELSYNPSNTWLTSKTVQGALDELNQQKGCPVGNLCHSKDLVLGDYVRYTPSKTSYTTDTTKTGYTSTQTINPSELNLWRVIRLNQDGTVDIISENVSTQGVYFSGQTGYQNFVGYLNVLASQYETSGITVGSRHFGYDGQTEYITNITFENPPTWTCSTGGTCTPDPDDYEASGGGDTSYLTDYNLLNDALGTRVAKRVGSPTLTYYWMASRYYYYSRTTLFGWSARYVNDNGTSSDYTRYNLYYYNSGLKPASSICALRPIVTLKSELTYSGLGVQNYPMEIQ